MGDNSESSEAKGRWGQGSSSHVISFLPVGFLGVVIALKWLCCFSATFLLSTPSFTPSAYKWALAAQFPCLSLQAWDGNGCPPVAHPWVLHHSLSIPLSLPKPSCVVPLLTSLQWNPLSYAICFYGAPAWCNYFKKHYSEWLCCGDHTHRPVREGVADKMTIKACRDWQNEPSSYQGE